MALRIIGVTRVRYMLHVREFFRHREARGVVSFSRTTRLFLPFVID
ncbi:hypothetical protein TSAR_012091 [Trichomalopsis sarcophagae]|uniref:Uncharacterized protein n=1 Tax=Trichomalopsis sarcophagae TaxID=543379 RepID=A0A232ET79_9HYME|nr:hypothetical protein TSAR_012091 [Trichomalopsis sarcophagae]